MRWGKNRMKSLEELAFQDPAKNWLNRHCPFTGITCDVSANGGDGAYFDRNSPGLTAQDRKVFGPTGTELVGMTAHSACRR